MDHFPIFDDNYRPHIVIYYDDVQKWQKEANSTETLPFSLDEMDHALTRGNDESMILSCLEELLFFKPLERFHEICSIAWQRVQFVGFHEDIPVLTSRPIYTEMIPKLDARCDMPSLRCIRERYKSLRIPAVSSGMTQLAALREPMLQFLRDQRSLFGRLIKTQEQLGILVADDNTYMATLICFTGAILFETLVNIARAYRIIDGLTADITTQSLNVKWLYDSAIVVAHNNGWCPNRLENACADTISMLAYAAMARPRPDNSHKSCTREYCSAKPTHIVVEDHHTAGCSGNCASISVPPDELCQILSGDDFPVVRDIGKGSAPAVEVRASNDIVEYAAISHVWSVDIPFNPNNWADIEAKGLMA